MNEVIEREKQTLLAPKRAGHPDIVVSDRFKGLKVLGLVADTSACGHYRVINPLHMLKMHGADVHYSSFHSMDDFFKHDVIIVPRQHSKEVYETIRHVAWEGKLLVFELDDDLHSVLPESPAYVSYHPGSPELKMLPKVIEACHGFTTTTPEIAKWYYQWNRNVSVLDNYIDFSFRDWGVDVQWDNGYPIFTKKEFVRPERWKDKIVVGWGGGMTHVPDLKLIGSSIKTLLEKNPNMLFVFNSSYQMFEWFKNHYDIPEDRIEHIEAKHFMDHPTCLHAWDIGLAPILSCQFNLAKCVVGSTKVYTPKGIFKIEDLHKGREADMFYPLKLDVHTQDGVKSATHFYSAGVQDTLKITTKRGFETEVSLTHRLKDGGNGWKYAKDFQVGDQLQLAQFEHSNKLPYVKVPYFWTCTRKDSKVSDKTLASSLPIITINEIWAELLGFILSDGHVGKNGQISICVSGQDEDVKDRIVYLLRMVGLEPTINQPTNRYMFYVSVQSKPVAEFLKSLGIESNKKLAKETLSIPDVIWRSKKSVIAAFLKGMFEGDGTVSKDCGCSISSCSHKLMQDVHEILLGFGIVAKLDRRAVKCQNDGVHEASIVYLNRANTDIFHREIGFVSKRKNERMKTIISRPHSNAYVPITFVDPIVLIERSRNEVFDISVPDGEQWLGGGFVQHNSGLKIEEGAAAGAAMVASHVGPYARFARKHPGKVITVGNGKGCARTWAQAIQFLIDNPDKLESMKQKGRDLIIEQYSLEKNFHLWPLAWKAMAEKVARGEVGPPDVIKDSRYYKSYAAAGRNDPCPCDSGGKYKSCCGEGAFG